MSTTLLAPTTTSTHRPMRIHSARAATSRPPAPAVYIGTVAGFRELPAIDLYNLLAPVGEHPVGSTVSRRTLERFGYRVPAELRRDPAAETSGATTHSPRWVPGRCA